MAYTPASTVFGTSGLNHVAITYYKKRGLDRLMKKFVFRDACMPDMIPKQSGRTVQWFRYSNFAANVTPKAASPSWTNEGTVGVGLPLQSGILTANIAQYTDFVTVSDFLKDTAIDEVVENTADLLSYRAGLSVDTITRNEIDSAQASTNLDLLGSFYRAADARNARHQMQGLDILPLEEGAFAGKFMGIIHPYVSYDLMNDPTAGSVLDIYKYTNPKAFIDNEDRGVICEVADVRFIESTNVAVVGSSTHTWRVYIFGKGGVGKVELEGRGPSELRDPSKQRFKLNIIPGQPSIADPEGVIGAAVSYNYVYVAKILDTTNYRYRTAEAPSSIVA